MATEERLPRILTLPNLVLFGLAYMVPLTLFSTYGIVTQITEGRLPAAYIITLIVMLFTTFSYGVMARNYPYSGSLYTYVQQTLSHHLGFFAGWILLLDYLFLPIINYLLIGIYLHAQFPTISMGIWILLAVGGITIINIVGVRVMVEMNKFLVVAQLLFLLLFTLLTVRTLLVSGAPLLSLTPFYQEGIPLSGLFAGAAILCLSFLGFDAITTLAEESQDPTRIMPKAIFLVTLIGGSLFIGVAYLGHLIYPDYTTFKAPESVGLEIAYLLGGSLFQALFLTAYILGSLASAMVSHTAASRLLYVMGRDGVLPRGIFGTLSPRFKTPLFSILVVSLCALSALFFTLEMLSSFISFGALTAFTLIHLAVIRHSYRAGAIRGVKGVLAYLICPLIGISLSLWLWSHLSDHALFLGLGWISLGGVYLYYLTEGFRQPPPILHDVTKPLESSVAEK